VSHDLWSKVDFNLPAQPQAQKQAVAPAAAQTTVDWESAKRFWRWRRVVLDVVATFLWVYGFLKLFIIDFDSDLIGHAASYRFFVFLAIQIGRAHV
jgi:hypothetical protein